MAKRHQWTLTGGTGKPWLWVCPCGVRRRIKADIYGNALHGLWEYSPAPGEVWDSKRIPHGGDLA